jgi:hypothetical protein
MAGQPVEAGAEAGVVTGYNRAEEEQYKLWYLQGYRNAAGLQWAAAIAADLLAAGGGNPWAAAAGPAPAVAGLGTWPFGTPEEAAEQAGEAHGAADAWAEAVARGADLEAIGDGSRLSNVVAAGGAQLQMNPLAAAVDPWSNPLANPAAPAPAIVVSAQAAIAGLPNDPITAARAANATPVPGPGMVLLNNAFDFAGLANTAVTPTMASKEAGSTRILPPQLTTTEPTYSRSGDMITATWEFGGVLSKQQLQANAPVCKATNTATQETIKPTGQRTMNYDAGSQTGTFSWSYETSQNTRVLLSFSDNEGHSFSINTAYEPTVEAKKDERVGVYVGCWRAAFDGESKKAMWGFAADGGDDLRCTVTFKDKETGDVIHKAENLTGRSYFEEDRSDGKCFVVSVDMTKTTTGKTTHFEKEVDLRHQ